MSGPYPIHLRERGVTSHPTVKAASRSWQIGSKLAKLLAMVGCLESDERSRWLRTVR